MHCVVCGKKAEVKNSLGLPSCKKHTELPTTIPRCPECESQMQLRQRKNGSFWGCPDFPRCFGSRNLPNPMEELDVL